MKLEINHSELVGLITKNLNGFDLTGKNVTVDFKTTRKPTRITAVVLIGEDDDSDAVADTSTTEEVTSTSEVEQPSPETEEAKEDASLFGETSEDKPLFG